jgi:integrase/recombinase XerD
VRSFTERSFTVTALSSGYWRRVSCACAILPDWCWITPLIRHGTQWWIQIPAVESKNCQPIEKPWPEQLIAPLETYLTCHRQVFLELRHGSQPSERALSLSFSGVTDDNGRNLWDCDCPNPRSARYGQKWLKSLSKLILDFALAKGLAIEDPGHIGIAARLLGHRTGSTTERYYNQARAVEASRLMQNYRLALRREFFKARCLVSD